MGKGEAEGREWAAKASRAMQYLQEHGSEENLTPEQRDEYERLTREAQDAADRHDDAREDRE